MRPGQFRYSFAIASLLPLAASLAFGASRPPAKPTVPVASPTASPVWLDWGAPAFAQARREGKLLFVVVGAYGCHPCRALERDVLEEAAVAHSLGSRFVAVRVDADAEPHVADALSLAARDRGALAALPLVLTLTVDGRIADAAAPVAEDDASAPQLFARWLDLAAGPQGDGRALPAARPAEATAGLDDPLAPPALPALRASLESLGAEAEAGRVQEAGRLLEGAARSPYRDHIGGGFHRGRTALHPRALRYEKRLADNALWLRAFARGYGASGDLLLRDAAQEIVAWAVREMRDSTGAFWATLDAESGGLDGAFYRFSREDVTAALGADRAKELLAMYDVLPPNLLSLRGSPFAGLGGSLEVLRTRRGRRVRPAPDERILAGANGLFVGALAVSGQQLRRGSDLELARRAAQAVLARLGPPAAMKHSAGAGATGAPATLADYAYLAEGLLDLHAATGEARWPEAARALVDGAVLRLWDPPAGGFRTGESKGELPAPGLRTARDADLPAPNGVMASVLARLGSLTREARYLRLAERTLEAFRAEAERDPRSAATLDAAATAYRKAAALADARR